MGYKLLYDKQILFDVYSGDYVTDAQLSMSVNAVSYFDFTISLTHSLYDIVAEHAGIVELYFDDAKLFSGEITEISVDLNGNKDITCAGALDYLSYTLVRPYSTIDGEADLLAPSSVDGYFNWLIEQHNKHCLDSRKHFFVGVNQGNLLDNNNYIYRASSELPTTSSEIEDKILNSIGGYLYVRYKDDKNILDLYADTHEANTQIIDFGVNITDFVKTTSTDDQYTAVIATGYTPDPPEDDPQKKMTPITLEGCVDGGTPYSPSIVKMGDVVYDVNAVARYGYKEYHVSNDDIKTYDGLLQYACKVLNKLLSPSLSVSVKAVDLSLYMKDKYEHMQVGQAVRVRSKLHNIDEYLVVNSITLDMNNPENTEYQLGESYDTLTGQQSSYLRSLNSSIVSNLDSVAKLDSETKKNAKDIADTKVVASNAANKANQASEDATNATSKANEANNKADTATETANSASSKADEANAKANTATNTANSANAKADEAKADAANANTKADAATETANSASQNAQKAQEGVAVAKDAASKAQAAADKAQADANANMKAVAQAQSTADAAKKAAADAQEKAENVESNLESANAVIEQHSNKLGELSTKVSNAVTNADAALTASTEAKQTATEASTTANTAYEDSQTAITNSTKATQTATEAKTTAESAVSTANDSLMQSSSAVQTANRIENTLTTEYQTKADSDALYATKSSLTETSESIKMEVSATYATKSTVEALQNVADNAIESWRGSGVPTSENKPASDWTTIEEKKRHSGDLYYDKDTGKAYRWGSDDGVVYSWVLNQDTDITKALQDASNAQKSANAAQSTANGAVTAAGNAQKSAEGAQSTADSAKTAAANAQKTADTVQLDVDQLKIDIPGTYATKASLETTAESITAQVESVSTTANSAVTAASKAQQTADAINVNLTKNYQTKENADNTYATKASLSATSEGLSASITKAQQTADGAVNAASNAQQTADAININLTKNYQTTKDADDKYATQSSLNATADSITASVSKTYSTKTELTSAIDGISVGGRNLALGTAKFENPNNIYSISLTVNSTVLFKNNYTAYCNRAWRHYAIYLYHLKDKYDIKVGDTLTYSIYFKFTTNEPKDTDAKRVPLQWFIRSGEPDNGKNLGNLNIDTDSDVWRRYSHTFVVSENMLKPGVSVRIECSYYTESDYTSPRLTQWWSSPKLEFGNKATDWSPAPEDLVAESKTYTDAQIKVSADSINSTVSSVKTTADNALSNANSALDQINEIPDTYATKTEVNQTATDLTTTITTAQNTANDAKGAAESAQTTANEAKGTADSAKTSTNVLETLIRQSGDGVEVAKKVNDEYTSTKTLMGPDGFYIKDLTDTALTQVKSNSIILGKETESHMHINPENVRLLNGDEKELAKFYENGVSLSSNALTIHSPIKDDPIQVTDIKTVGGFYIHSVVDDDLQAIVPKNSNNTCEIAGFTNLFFNSTGGENPSTITEASSSTVISARANAKGSDTADDTHANIEIDAFSSLLNSSSTITKESSISIEANSIHLRAKNHLNIKGYELKDFVKEFGTSKTTDSQWPAKTWEWRWIKTYSGKCFAWGECGFNIGCTNAWGSGYYDHVCPVYPFKLSKWNVQASTSFIGGGIGLTGIYDDSATQCPIYIWSAVYQNTGTMYVKVFVEGALA